MTEQPYSVEWDHPLPEVYGCWVRQEDPEIVAHAAEYLSPEEYERYRAFRSLRRRQGFLLGRLALRHLLSRVYGEAPSVVSIRVDRHGRPLVSQGYVSLSHSGIYAWAVWAPFPLGVDIERKHARPPGLYRYFLRPEEVPYLERMGTDVQTAQVRLWTLKEAVLKARGSGLRYSPRKVRLRLSPEVYRGIAMDEEGERWHLIYGERYGVYWAMAIPCTAIENMPL